MTWVLSDLLALVVVYAIAARTVGGVGAEVDRLFALLRSMASVQTPLLVVVPLPTRIPRELRASVRGDAGGLRRRLTRRRPGALAPAVVLRVGRLEPLRRTASQADAVSMPIPGGGIPTSG